MKALPKMAAAAKSPALKKAIEAHQRQTEGHIKRLDQVFKLCGQKPEAIPCEAIKGLLKEGDETAGKFKGGRALDAGIVAAAQAVEHYEMARYGSLCAWANELGIDGAAKILEATLVEEKETDLALTSLAQQSVNVAAMA